MNITEPIQQAPIPATSGNGQKIKVGVIPLFSTWLYLCENGPKHLNEELQRLANQLMHEQASASKRSNHGGWHYAQDFLKLDQPVVAEFRTEMEEHVQAFLNYFRPDSRKKKDRFRLEGWINVNRTGDYNVLHCHPGCFLSATYYVNVPVNMQGGEICFRDPRSPAVAMVETPGIELPWVGPGTGIPFTPATGHLLLFPSWLEHRVEPFEGAGERVSIAFNVCNP